jgi:hypothetical protein
MKGTNAVQTQTTDSNGAVTFSGIDTGDYTVHVTATDHAPADLALPHYDKMGADVPASVSISPLPISWEAGPTLQGGPTVGIVFFSNTSAYVSRDKTGHAPLTQADLFNSAFQSPSLSVSYKYVGYIPNFPELGHFGGTGEPTIWVIMQQALLPQNQWNNQSSTNEVAVFGIQGTGKVGTAGNYTTRFLLSQPFDGPGTAHNWTPINLTSTANSRVAIPNTSFTALNPVWIGGGATPLLPPAGDIPPGWMAQGICQCVLAPGQSISFFAYGSYKNVCDDLSEFWICPTGDPMPDPDN